MGVELESKLSQHLVGQTAHTEGVTSSGSASGFGTMPVFAGGPSPSTKAGLLHDPSTAQLAGGQKTSGGRPVNITYISADGTLAAAVDLGLSIGAISGTSVDELVEGVIARANGRPIGRLSINGHGTFGAQSIGPEASLSTAYWEELKKLVRLRGLFHPTQGEVILGGCQVGGGPSGEALLRKMALLLGVKVTAGVGNNRPLLPGLEGSVVTAGPGGEVSKRENINNELNRWVPFRSRSVMAEAGALPSDKREETLRELSAHSRYKIVSTLVGIAYTVNRAEGDLIVEIFAFASPEDRRSLYRYVETHQWQGRFFGETIRDVWDRDGLYIALTAEQRKNLKALLNEGWYTPINP